MFVRSLTIDGFLHRKKPVQASFNNDLNIITGRNGAGKTNVLKLLWYVISGNILQALKEVPFDRVIVETDEYTCEVQRLGSVDCRVLVTQGQKTVVYEDITDEDGDAVNPAEDQAAEYLIRVGTSTFLPTFRRIEGGFSISSPTRPTALPIQRRGGARELEEALATVANRLSNGGHRFVSALSTNDISEVLYRRYSELTAQYNSLQTAMSRSIVDQIKHYQIAEERAGSEPEAATLLEIIRSEIEKVESDGVQIMAPLTEIQKVVQSLFIHKGIKIGQLSFGEAAESINSEALSAGEKQMLSFISYNGLARNSIIFIDEPELSLHVDWQRSLFGILQRQQVSNQFIIATHSPFIYSKFPEKEILLDVDRGDAEIACG